MLYIVALCNVALLFNGNLAVDCEGSEMASHPDCAAPALEPAIAQASLLRIANLVPVANAECDAYCANNYPGYPGIHYNGLCYATIGGADPESANTGCENTFHTMPTNWQVASDTPETEWVANNYQWGSHVVVYNVGTVASGSNDKLDETWSRTSNYCCYCGSCYVVFQAPDQYRASYCSLNVLITTQCQADCNKDRLGVDCEDDSGCPFCMKCCKGTGKCHYRQE